ncbi:MAG: CheY-like chemotaxis protein [Psychroserpens sp.]|jgi:CheY-like chemotaxis protein
MLEVLVVEDNPNKRNKIVDFIKSSIKNSNVQVCTSFTSGWNKVQGNKFDLICLDMSLPTFDQSDSETGGRFRVFGGRELAQKMKRKQIKTKYVFITHYKNFSDNKKSYSFEELKSELMTEYEESCLDVIFYSNKSSEWREKLVPLLMEVNT